MEGGRARRRGGSGDQSSPSLRGEVACSIQREKKEATKIDIDFAPTVTFENGKAVKAKINWGKLSAPTLVKGAMWTATATDNTLNVLQSTLVEDINDFISKKCDEVKDEWAKTSQ